MRYCSECTRVWKQAHQYCPDDGNALQSVTRQQDPLVGLKIDGRYKLKSFLGSGGTGFVYVADHIDLRRDVALKMLFADRARDPANIRRLRREARALAAIEHPNIVRVLDYGGGESAMPYLVMEKAMGRPLDLILTHHGPLPVVDVLRIGVQIASALSLAHDRGIVHRDLKPANIQVDAVQNKLRARILDFGFAFLAEGSTVEESQSYSERLTRQGVIFGTPEYMAPEQIRGSPAQAHTDLYALGIVFFELLSGKPPFYGPVASKVFSNHLQKRPPPLPLPENVDNTVAEGLRDLINALLMKEPNQRPRSADDVKERLLTFEEGLSGEALRASWLVPARTVGGNTDTLSDSAIIPSTLPPEAPFPSLTPKDEENLDPGLWEGIAHQRDSGRVLEKLLSHEQRARRVRLTATIGIVSIMLVVSGWWAIQYLSTKPGRKRERITSARLQEIKRSVPEAEDETGRTSGERSQENTLSMIEGSPQEEYEKARHEADLLLVSRGLRLRDTQASNTLRSLWKSQNEAARNGKFNMAVSYLREFESLISSSTNEDIISARLKRAERTSSRDPLNAAMIRAMKRNLSVAAKSPAGTRKMMRRIDGLSRDASDTKR